MAFCTECGADIPAGMRFCTGCGRQADAPQPPQAAAPAPAQVQAQAAAACPAPQQAQAPVAYQAPPPRPAVLPAGQSADAAPPKGSRFAVMGTGAYFGAMLLFCIPVIGWVACLVMAFAGGSQNRKNFARAMLIFLVIGIVLSVALYFVSTWVFEVVAEYMSNGLQGSAYGLWG